MLNNKMTMSRLISLLLIIGICGCAPHFYEAKSLLIAAENTYVTSYGELDRKCIARSNTPLIYVLKKDLYSIEFRVLGLQLGMKLLYPEDERYTLSSSILKENDPSRTGIDGEYTHYVSSLEPRDLSIKILERDQEVGVEKLSLSIETCKAVVIDAV